MFKHVGLAACLIVSMTAAEAAPIGFGFNAGPVTEIDDPRSTGAFSGILLGENILVSFTIDDATPDIDLDPFVNWGRFEDDLGSLSIAGMTSGTEIVMVGVRVNFEGVRSLEVGLDAEDDGTDDGYFLDGDADVTADRDILTDPSDLTKSINELQALLSENVFTGIENLTSSEAQLAFYDSADGKIASAASMTFGPVPTDPAAVVPLPASGLLLLSGVSLLGGRRLTRRRARVY